MSSNICIGIQWKFYCYFQEILLKKNYCKWKFQNFNHYHEQKIQSGWGYSLELIKMYDILHVTSILSFILFCFLFVVIYIYYYCGVISYNFKTQSVNPLLFRNASGNTMTMMELFRHFLKFSYILMWLFRKPGKFYYWFLLQPNKIKPTDHSHTTDSLDEDFLVMFSTSCNL